MQTVNSMTAPLQASRKPTCTAPAQRGLEGTVQLVASAAGAQPQGPPAAMEAPGVLARLRSGFCEEQGQRHSMEDASVVCDDLRQHMDDTMVAEVPDVAALYAVFDGHHGAAAANFASDHLVPNLLSACTFPADPKQSLATAYLAIDHSYYLATSSDSDSAGTTACSALLWGGALYVANAGDSRAVLSRRGKAMQLTRDHKADEPAERRRIEAAGGFVCADGRLCGDLAVSRALGNHHRNLKAVPAPPSHAWRKTAQQQQQQQPEPLVPIHLQASRQQQQSQQQQQQVPKPNAWQRPPHIDTAHCSDTSNRAGRRSHSSGSSSSTVPLTPGAAAVAAAIPLSPLAPLAPPTPGATAAAAKKPLIADPELSVTHLSDQDEFLILGCDGLWDVFSSQRAVEFARLRLMAHNDPQLCAQELVAEALRMHSADNISVIVVALTEGPPQRRSFSTGPYALKLQAQGLLQLASLLDAPTP